jgi:hypothetical protein
MRDRAGDSWTLFHRCECERRPRRAACRPLILSDSTLSCYDEAMTLTARVNDGCLALNGLKANTLGPFGAALVSLTLACGCVTHESEEGGAERSPLTNDAAADVAATDTVAATPVEAAGTAQSPPLPTQEAGSAGGDTSAGGDASAGGDTSAGGAPSESGSDAGVDVECRELSQHGCELQVKCQWYGANVYDVTEECLTVGGVCGERCTSDGAAITYVTDPSGRVWQFGSTCTPPEWGSSYVNGATVAAFDSAATCDE